MNATQEQWRAIAGYEGYYEVSDRGRVRSIARTILTRRGHRRIPERVLSLSLSKRGYLKVSLSRDGKVDGRRVHQLVLEAFTGPRPSDTSDGRHLNDISTDNRLVNLAWGTKSDNMRDLVRNGNHAMAKKTHCPRRHAFSPENTLSDGRKRRCRICFRDQQRQWYRRDRAKKLLLKESAPVGGY